MNNHNFTSFTDIQNQNYMYSQFNPGELYSHNSRIWMVMKPQVRAGMFTQQELIDYGLIELVEPGTDQTAWMEIPKDCENCKCKAMTIKTSGSTPDDEVTSCPYAKAHEDATQQQTPDLCQAWNPIIMPTLPVQTNMLKHKAISPELQKEILKKRLRLGVVSNVELQDIIAEIV